MAEVIVKVVQHFKIDPAKQTIGAVNWPERIKKTIAVGDEIVPGEVSFSALSEEDRAVIDKHVADLVREAVRTAQPLAEAETGSGSTKDAGEEETSGTGQADEMSAF